MVDLRTRYLGFELRNPLVLSACPLSDDMRVLRRLEESGAGAVVMRSLFEEQIEREAMDLHGILEEWSESYVEAQTYFPEFSEFRTGPEAYAEAVAEAKRTLSIPVIASLNGASPGGWTRYAKRLAEAGADALELNVYFVAADAEMSGAEVESRYIELVASVREVVSIPLAVKIGPFFSSVPHMARRLVDAGADGLVLFNRFLQPDIDLARLSVEPQMRLSTSDELKLPLRWIAILHGRLQTSLAATTGVHTHEDALKALLAGADVAMMASALLQHGPEYISTVIHGVRTWLIENEYDSIEQMKGSLSQESCPDPAAFERAHYMRAIAGYRGRGAAPGGPPEWFKYSRLAAEVQRRKT